MCEESTGRKNVAKEAKMEANVKSQPKIEEMFKRKISKSTKEHIDNSLIIFLAKASLPLHIAELPSFKQLLQSLNASYAMPSNKTLLKLMRKQVDKIDEENRRLCASDDTRVAITTDVWSSKKASCSLLAITGHALDKKFSDRVNVVLDCVPLEEESHTSEVIELKISQCLSNIGISKESVSFMVADGATVMVKAASDLRIPYIHCCAHVINLAVSASLSPSVCAAALKRVKSIVAKLNKSGKMKKTFKRFLIEDEPPSVIPMNDSPTSWCSTYFMLCDSLNAMPALEKLVTSFDLSPIENGELRVLKALRSFLQPYPNYDQSDLSHDEWKETTDRFLATKMHSFTPIEPDEDATERSATLKGTDVCHSFPRKVQPARPVEVLNKKKIYSTTGIIYGNKRRGRLTPKNARLFLMINANSNKDASRASKAWIQRECSQYGCAQESSDSYSSSEESNSDDPQETVIEDQDFYIFDG